MPRANEAGGIYHALNRGNLRVTVFHTDEDFQALERILLEALEIHQVELSPLAVAKIAEPAGRAN